jgi:hypothetical protein
MSKYPTITHIIAKATTILLFVLTTYLLLTPIVETQVEAQSVIWTTPEMMGASWFPEIATDSTGAVYLAWSSGDPAYDLVMYSSNANGREWSTPNDIQALIAPVGRYATRPALLIDPYGTLHLSYRGDTIWYSHVPLQQANDAQAWSEPERISSAGYFSKLAYTSDDKLHLFFTENKVRVECTNCFHLMYQQSANGEGWSSAQDITPALDGMAKPQIVVDDQNNIIVVFEAGYGGDLGQLSDPATVMYVASYDGGETWTSPLRFAPERGDGPNAQARNVAIGIDGEQKLVAVWWAIPEDVVYYQVSQDQGRSWSTPTPIANVLGAWAINQARLDDYTLATDSAGHLHLVLAGRRTPAETNVSLLHVEWDGSNWSAPDLIAAYNGDIPEWPRLAIGNGNQLHVAWFVRDQANLYGDTTNYRVWYARGESSAPYIAPVAVAIPTPTNEIDVDVSIQETIPVTVPSKMLDESLRQPTNELASLDDLMTENDDISLLVMSLLPTMFLMGLVTLIRRRRKNR